MAGEVATVCIYRATRPLLWLLTVSYSIRQQSTRQNGILRYQKQNPIDQQTLWDEFGKRYRLLPFEGWPAVGGAVLLSQVQQRISPDASLSHRNQQQR